MAADLQCMDSIKNRSREPSARSLENLSINEKDLNLSTRRPRNPKPSNQLYEIEVIDRDGPRVKIHYTGYSHSYDEWRMRSEIEYKKPSFSELDDEDDEDETFSPLRELACSIKKKLIPSRHQDPAVRIQIPCHKSSFDTLKEGGVSISNNRFKISSYDSLKGMLGEQWHFWICNSNGDFSYVILDTVRFHLVRGRSILDFNVKKNPDGSLEFDPAYIEQNNYIVFQFVRGDGNKTKLLEFI